MDLTLCCCDDACEAELSEDCDPTAAACSAVSSVVGKSISRWIWMPSPGPMCEMWLKLEGADISFERRSGLLQSELDRRSVARIAAERREGGMSVFRLGEDQQRSD